MQWQVLKETTYFILTDETDMFFRPLERLSKVETPSPPPGNIHKENKKMFITQPYDVSNNISINFQGLEHLTHEIFDDKVLTATR